MYFSSVAWGDFDNDGDLDILLTGRGSGAVLVSKVYRNNGNGTFTDTVVGLAAVLGSSVAWGDYDNDGDLDILLTGDTVSGGRVSKVYRNNGNGTFTNIGAGLTAVRSSSVAWGDYDNDGDLDILLTGENSSNSYVSKVYRNDGNGTFTDTGAGLTAVGFSAVAWGDYDNDGDLDILLTGLTGGSDVSKVYRNDACVPNSRPNQPDDLYTTFDAGGTSFYWLVAGDAETGDPGLHYNLRVGTTPGGSQIVSPMASASGYRQVPRLGNARQAGFKLGLAPGTYYWSVQAIDPAWSGSTFAPEQTFTVTATGVPGASDLPLAFALGASRPNPSFSRTTIGFDLPRDARVSLRIHDVSGRLVRTLAQGRWPAGRHQVEWDGTTRGGVIAPDGVYFYVLEAEGFRAERRLVRLR